METKGKGAGPIPSAPALSAYDKPVDFFTRKRKMLVNFGAPLLSLTPNPEGSVWPG